MAFTIGDKVRYSDKVVSLLKEDGVDNSHDVGIVDSFSEIWFNVVYVKWNGNESVTLETMDVIVHY